VFVDLRNGSLQMVRLYSLNHIITLLNLEKYGKRGSGLFKGMRKTTWCQLWLREQDYRQLEQYLWSIFRLHLSWWERLSQFSLEFPKRIFHIVDAVILLCLQDVGDTVWSGCCTHFSPVNVLLDWRNGVTHLRNSCERLSKGTA